MPVTVQGFNVGTDVGFSISDNYGDVFIDSSMGYLDDFESQGLTHMLSIMPITTGGMPIHQCIWSGGSGRMSFTRFGPSLTQMFMDLEAQYYSAGVIPQFSLTVEVRNRDASIDEYLYSGFQFGNPHHGAYRSTREVTQNVNFVYSQLQGTGALTAFLAGVAQAA